MSLATYSDLQTAVANFLHRADLSAIIPDFIALAEVRINGDLDARLQDTRVTLSTVAGTETVALPSDTINIRTLVCQGSPNVVLDYQTPDAISTAYTWGNSGTPQAYTVSGSNLILRPIPDAVYSLDTIYKARVPTITSGSNWLLTTYPNVYLYGSLCEAAPYIKDDARVQLWESKYSEAIDSVNSQDWYSGSSMRVKTDVKP